MLKSLKGRSFVKRVFLIADNNKVLIDGRVAAHFRKVKNMRVS